jgi:hypothetical protein
MKILGGGFCRYVHTTQVRLLAVKCTNLSNIYVFGLNMLSPVKPEGTVALIFRCVCQITAN